LTPGAGGQYKPGVKRLPSQFESPVGSRTRMLDDGWLGPFVDADKAAPGRRSPYGASYPFRVRAMMLDG
jgi:hypothetical protein